MRVFLEVLEERLNNCIAGQFSIAPNTTNLHTLWPALENLAL